MNPDSRSRSSIVPALLAREPGAARRCTVPLEPRYAACLHPRWQSPRSHRLRSATDAGLGDAVWYSLTDPTREEDKFVESCLGIDIPTRREMQDIEPSARLYSEEGAEFMTITALMEDESGQLVKTPITFVLRNDQLVTVRYADPKPFRLYERLVARPANGEITGERVMIGLLESFIDRLAQLLENTGDGIDQISREVFGNKATKPTRKTRDLQSLIEQIGKKGDVLTLARESLVSISRLVSYHQSAGNEDQRDARDRKQDLKVLQRDAAALSDHAAFLSDKITLPCSMLPWA